MYYQTIQNSCLTDILEKTISVSIYDGGEQDIRSGGVYFASTLVAESI